MKDRRTRFFEELRDKEVWLAGIGVTNTPTMRMFASRHIRVSACDRRTREQIGEELCAGLEAEGVRLRLGPQYLDDIERADVLFRTPGMYYNLPVLQQYRTHGGVLTSEMEVFCALAPCPLFAVTGSDGKTTTTTLISEMLREAGKQVYLGGNIGRALLPEILEIGEDDCAVVELSSFQLISMRCAPRVAVVTNVTPNHLDVHADMEEYIATKRGLLAHQDALSATVLGADNAVSASFAPLVRGQCLLFSLERPVENGAYYDASDGGIYIAAYHQPTHRLMDASEIRIPGMHNIANYLAAICAVRGYVPDDVIRKVAREFGGVEHRIELVRELNGARWYNDSIASSPTRTIAALRAFDRKIILLAGGYDKNIPYAPLAQDVVEKVKTLILCGDTADKIEAAVTAHPDYRPGAPEILRVKDIPEAVCAAHRLAGDGDIVSLSPASASFDFYQNFEARGRHFKELVNAL